MSLPRPRFMFDTDFSAIEKPPLHQFTPDELDIRLAEREASGYARGFDDGEKAKAAHIDARIADAIDRLAHSIDSLDASILAHRRSNEAAAAHLAFAFARKLAGSLLKDHLTTPLEDAFRALMADLTSDDNIVIAVHPSLSAAFDNVLGRLLAGHRAGLKLTIVPDASLAPGDGRIDWDGGGLVRDAAALEDRLGELIARTYPDPSPIAEETTP